jgi:hypothetical protein
LYLDRRLEHKNPASVLLPFEKSLLRPFAFVSPSNAVVFLHWTRAAKQNGLLSNCLHIKHQQKEDLYAKNIDNPSEKLTDKMTNFPLKTNNYKEVTKGYKNV